MEFLTGAPVWVWPLLAGLTLLGLQSTRERSTRVQLVCILPLLGLLGLRTVLALPVGLSIWAGFLAGYALATLLGFRLQGRWILNRQGNTVMLAGEWLTLITIMVVFWANFLRGVLQAVAPGQLAELSFVLPFTLVLGISSGLFLGRALRVIRADQSNSGSG
ncbi:hypothetical protein [Parasedimentitalea psychrophila]|uniref:DUF1453 domain-containing protein n=1 Tax=Parasedimentitalea psychrophila TaxID=2997337 RepID=A0A9Y2KWT8_9RHOB|nr:hypothetical protein [Parasedimentitalea psychrophila]WIY23466.1 hypothetical protein QPJ95_12425 [Parasedimentitalea psychrophila]